MIRLVHVSDFHLGVRFKQLIGVDVESFVNNRILNNIGYSVDYAIENNADLYLVTGDIFNKLYQSLEYSHRLIDHLLKLVDNNVSVLLIAGNHDVPRTRGVHNALYLVNKLGGGIRFIEIPCEKPIEFSLDGAKLGVVPLPYVYIYSRASNKIGKYIRDMLDKMGRVDYKVLAAHLDVSGAKYSDMDLFIRSFYMLPYRVNPDILYPNSFNYVALGHIHISQAIPGYPNMWYSGSINRVNFGEASEPKGFLQVDIDGELDVKFVEVSPIKMRVVKGLVYRKGFNIDDFFSDLEELGDLEDSLVKIEVIFDRDAWRDFRGAEDRIKRYLLESRRVKGFAIVHTFTRIAPQLSISKALSLERGWIIDRLREYIEALELPKDERKLMMEYAIKLYFP